MEVQLDLREPRGSGGRGSASMRHGDYVPPLWRGAPGRDPGYGRDPADAHVRAATPALRSGPGARRRARARAAAASPRSSRCSTRATRSRSSRATARSAPAASTRSRSARSRSSATYLVELEDAARRDPRVGRRAGQADARARGQAARRDRQGRARGSLRAVPAAPQDARVGRAREGPRAARGAHPRRRAPRAIRRPRPPAFVGEQVATRRRRARRRARHRRRGDRRDRRGPRVRAPRVRRARRARRREVVPGKDDEPTKFEQYYDVQRGGEDDPVAPLPRDPPRRGRGRAARARRGRHRAGRGRHRSGSRSSTTASPWAAQLRLAVADALKRLLAPSVENDVRVELKHALATSRAVDIFAGNLRNLLLAAPLGTAAVIGIDPGLRTGCKCAAIDATGKFLGTVTRLHRAGRRAAREGEGRLRSRSCSSSRRARSRSATAPAAARPRRSCKTAARRRAAWRRAPFVVPVNEAGASVYSASRPRARGVPRARSHGPRRDLDRAAPAGSARRARQDRAEVDRRRPVPARRPPAAARARSSTRSSRAASTTSASSSTPRARRCSATSPASASRSRRRSSLHRDAHGAFALARAAARRRRASGPRRSSRPPASCASRGARATRSTRRAVHPERYALVEQMAARSRRRAAAR